MNFRITGVVISVLLVLPAMNPTTAAAAQAKAAYSIDGDIGNMQYDEKIVNSGSASVASTGASVGNSTASAQATASFGKLSVYAQSHIDQEAHHITSTGSASFTDTFTIQPLSSALNGTLGKATFAMHLQGSVSGRGYPQLPSRLTANVEVRFNDDWYSSWHLGDPRPEVTPGVFANSDSADETHFWTTEFYYGSPMTFSFSAVAAAGDPQWGPVDSVANFSHTASLVGLSLQDANGNAITDYDIVNVASGHDYLSDFKATVTPEPASMILFGLGGAAMAFARRRKV